MIEPRDPLEAELEALRPRDPSHGLAHRIEHRLSSRHLPPWLASPLARAALAAVCLGAAAATATVLALHYPTRPQEKETLFVTPAVRPAYQMEDSPPTLQAYHRALAESPESLDSLLDRRADAAPANMSTPAPVYAFPRSNSDLSQWIGDN
jgi:hypothetical protein